MGQTEVARNQHVRILCGQKDTTTLHVSAARAALEALRPGHSSVRVQLLGPFHHCCSSFSRSQQCQSPQLSCSAAQLGRATTQTRLSQGRQVTDCQLSSTLVRTHVFQELPVPQNLHNNMFVRKDHGRNRQSSKEHLRSCAKGCLRLNFFQKPWPGKHMLRNVASFACGSKTAQQ